MSSAATDRRPPSQHSFSSLLPLNTIINDNEFPTLGARGTPSSGGFSPLPTTSSTFGTQSQSPLPFKDQGINHRNYATLMRTNDSLHHPEFQIQNEDFPALPGAGASVSDLTAPVSLASLNQTADMLATVGQQPECLNKHSGEVKGIQTLSDGEVTNIPGTMLADQYGMAGLVTYLRAVSDPIIGSLALGYDLTLLGLNLNLSERDLYATFGGPWAESPVRPHDLSAKVPEEYLTNSQLRDKLPQMKLNKLSEDVLFYLFYNCPGEVYQAAAAGELYNRDWRFHKSDGIWLTRSQYGGVKEQTANYEKGQYNVFDPLQWRKIPKELKLEYKELEDKPKLPAALSMGSVGGVIPPTASAGVGLPQQRHNT